jgi:hypothetical protein
MTTEELLAGLRSSPTDLARFVEAAASSELPYVLVPIAALKGWQARDPDAWVADCPRKECGGGVAASGNSASAVGAGPR